MSRLLNKHLLAFVVIAMTVTNVFAQNTAKESRRLTGRGVLNEHQNDWENARKLTYFPDKVPELAPLETRVETLETLVKGDFIDIAGWQLQVLQIVDESNALVTFGQKTYWLRGWDTNTIADKDTFRVVGPVQIIEPQRYETVAGSVSTIRAFEIMSPNRLKEQQFESVKDRMELIELKSGPTLKCCAIGQIKGGFRVIDETGELQEVKITDLTQGSLGVLRKQLTTQNKKAKPKKK